MTALTSDLRAGKFGRRLVVQNLEARIRPTTCGPSRQRVFPTSTQRPERYLELRAVVGGSVNLNAEGNPVIVDDELCVGNNLAAGRIKMSDGCDVRPRKSLAIVVF